MANVIPLTKNLVVSDATNIAHKCVRMINEYWFKRGYHVNAHIEYAPLFMGGNNYNWPVIKSNTINGSPVDHAR